MKKITITLIALLFGFTSLIAQSPQTFKYQAVARDNLGKILVNQLVGLRISILKDSPLGATMYMETHTKGTNEFGIVTLNVGGGTTVTGNFSNINWSNGEYFIKTELDIAGTGTYIFIGSSQLLSVPFALHSEYATKAGKAMNDQDTSATNELQTIVKTGNTITLSQNGGSIIDSDNQTLTLINGTKLTISNGDTIILPAGIAAQTLILSHDTLSITNGNQVVFIHDADRDSINEIQFLSRHGDTLFLSKGNFVLMSHNNDNDSTNEIQYLSKNHNTLNLSNGNSVVIDADTTNELQTLTFSNDTLYLSKGNFVKVNLSQIMPVNTCINSTSQNPPNGFSFSGNIIENSWRLKSSPNGVTIPYQTYQATVNNKLYLIGHFSNPMVQEYDPATNIWTLKTSAPQIMDNPSITVLNNKIYVIGGGVNTWEFDPLANTWTQKTSMYVARESHSACVFNNKIYITGGSNGSPINSVEVYDPSNDTWTMLNPMNNAHTNHSSVVYNNKIYILDTSIEEYDPQSNTWTNKANGGSCGFSNYSFLYNNKIYSVAGCSINEYDPSLDICSTKLSISQILHYTSIDFSVVNSANFIYILGGSIQGGVQTNMVQEFNIDSNTLTFIAPLNYSRAYANASVINNHIYIVGFDPSSSSSSSLFTLEEFNPAVIYIHCKN